MCAQGRCMMLYFSLIIVNTNINFAVLGSQVLENRFSSQFRISEENHEKKLTFIC